MALLALLTTSLLTFSLALACVKHDRLAALFPQFIAFGTGSLLVACVTEFLPGIDWGAGGHEEPTSLASFFVLMGVLLVVLADKYMAPLLLQRKTLTKKTCHEHHHGQHASFFIDHGAACSSIGCIIVCAFFDGLEIVAAFSIHSSTGWFVNAALLLHTVPEAVMAASLGASSAMKRQNVYINIGLVSGAIWLGGVSMLSASNWAPRETVLLPLATGVLLYTLLTHLLPAALKAPYAWAFLSLGGTLALFV